MPKKLTRAEFIERAKKVHGDLYDYSKVEYINADTKVCIICSEHGEFWQTPYSHVNQKQKCPVCQHRVKQTLQTFLQRAKELYGDKYDYSKVEYVDMFTKVCIICPIHGEFWMAPNSFLNNKQQCPKCQHQSWANTTEEFIVKMESKFPDQFTYEKTEYKNNKTKVCITCKKHGDFWARPDNLMHQVVGCPKCASEQTHEKQRKLLKQFIEEAKKVHGDKYDYSKVKYKNTDTKICIVCPEHGKFLQTPYNHIKGHGCPKCCTSNLEKNLESFLIDNNISFESQKTFDWLIYKSNLYLDFYLPDYNVAIECQGEQHFKPIEFFGGEKGFQYIQNRDITKKQLCTNHGINILYYSKIVANNVFNDLNELLQNLKYKNEM